MARKPTDEVQLKLRFGEVLRRKLERAAEQAERSLNAEIVYRLERSFEWQRYEQLMLNEAYQARVQEHLAFKEWLLKRDADLKKREEQSSNEENEQRLSQPFDRWSSIDVLLGGDQTRSLLMTCARAIQLVELEKGKKWKDDWTTWMVAKAAIGKVLDCVKEPREGYSPLLALMQFDIAENTAIEAVEIEKADIKAKQKANQARADKKKNERTK
jgi:hypothetical protein